jgi:phosphoglucosamine mutase
LYPQKLINVQITKGFAWKESVAIAQALELVEKRLLGRGRVLLRASGTEPLLRVMVEGDDVDLVAKEANYLADVVRLAVS